MKIPIKFKLFATTIDVVFDDVRMNDIEAVGFCEGNQSRISLTTSYEGKMLSEDSIKNTFYHERTHAILDAMREFDLSQNEKFVDTFSKLLRQADETAEFG